MPISMGTGFIPAHGLAGHAASHSLHPVNNKRQQEENQITLEVYYYDRTEYYNSR